MLLNRFAKATVQRFSTAWQSFWTFLQRSEGFHTIRNELLDAHTFAEKLRASLLWQISLWLNLFLEQFGPSQSRNVYAALIAVPCCEQLRFEGSLKSAKRAVGL